MMFRSLAFAAVVLVAPVAGATTAVAQAMSIDELMRVTALDEVFTQFGAGIEESPEQQGTPFTGSMQAAWSSAARQVFDAQSMHAELRNMLEGKFTGDEMSAYSAFFTSEFGERVTDIERTVAMLPPDGQLAAREAGISLAEEGDAGRHEQIEEMLELISADITMAMVRQSVRGLLVGLSVTNQQGDIEVPWEEIDAHIESIMPEIEADVALTQRAIMFFAYRDLSEAELEQYLEFLRTEPARRFYAFASFSIGQIVAGRMETFGETLAQRLARVGV